MDLLDALEHAAARGPRPAAWAEREPILAGLDLASLRAVLADGRPPIAYERKDALLAALVRLAATETDAGLTLLACLVPGLRTIVARHWSAERHDEAQAAAVAALWQRIRRYPLDRRPRRIAANLLLDTLHDLIGNRTNATGTRGQLADGAAPEAGWSPAIIFEGARRAGVLSATDVTLIAATRLAGHDLRGTGERLGLTYAAARKRRRRAETRLATWWMPGRHRSGAARRAA
jgi:hypothetical protein